MAANPRLTRSHWPADESEKVLDVTVGDLLREAASRVPEHTALVAGAPEVEGRRRWTYAELLDEAERAARALLEQVEPGNHVAIWAPNIPEWVVLEFGAALAGLVLVTVNPAFQAEELEYVLRTSRSSAIFLMREFRGNPMLESLESVMPRLEHLEHLTTFDRWDEFLATGQGDRPLPDVDPRDPAQVQFTSGTTGFPKGALLHHRGICNNARFTALRCGVEPGWVWINPMPLFHTGGCVLGTLGPTIQLSTHVCVEQFDPSLVLELVESEGGRILCGVPTMLISLMEHPDFARRDLDSLRVVVSGGSTVPAELVRRIESTLGVRFGIVFGQTECSPVATQTCLDDSPEDKAETIGRALPQTEIKIVDPESGTVVPTGQVGELCTRGYHIMHGYFEMPQATAEAIDDEGWLHSGDLCSMDERGYFKVEGRLKDMIIRGGENIYSREIEELLYEHPGVAEVSVVGIPDEKWGEQVAAFVRRAPGSDVSAQALREYVRRRVARFKCPQYWRFVDEFPLTASGKIQKFKLRETFERTDEEG